MEKEYSPDEIRRLRVRSQLLGTEGAAQTVEQVTEEVCGLQAQQSTAATLGVRARSNGLTVADVETARFEDRTVLRTWCMRGTIHLVSTDDVPWMLSVFGPVFIAQSRTRLRRLGFDDSACDEAINVISGAMSDCGHVTRSEITEILQTAGFEFDPTGQAPYHLIRRAALGGVICEASPKDDQEAYGLLEEWADIDEFSDREASLRTLAQRYLSAYQPASIDDFASWSKLPMADVRASWESIEDQTTIVGGSETPLRVFEDSIPDETDQSLRLLPAYDSYLLGYETRDFAISPTNESQVWPGGGIIRPTVIADGSVIGTWKLDTARKHLYLDVTPFDDVPPPYAGVLREEINDVKRFLRSE